MFSGFYENLKIKNRSQRTIYNYERYLNKFESFLNGDPITVIKVDEYQSFLINKGWTSNNRYRFLYILRSYLKWAKRRGIQCIDYEEIELPKFTRDQRKVYLTEEEIDRLLESFNRKKGCLLKSKCIAMLLYVSGMRIGELISINKDEVDFINNQIRICGKGRQYRTVFFNEKTSELLQNYLSKRKDNYPPLFPGIKKEKDYRLNPTSIERSLIRHGKRAGIIKKVTPHVLRRSHATRLALDGAPLSVIRDSLGHRHSITTDIYVGFSAFDVKIYHTKSFNNSYETNRA